MTRYKVFYTFFAPIVLDGEDVDLEVEYICTPFISATSTQPAEGGEIEIVSTKLEGDGISLTDDEESKVLELCYADSLIAIADYENDRGDYLYEQARDRRAIGDGA